MKTKHLLKSFLIVSIAALTFVACGKKNNKTSKKTTNQVVSTSSNDDNNNNNNNNVAPEDKKLAANKYYMSDEGFIVRADATDNKLENLLIYSVLGNAVYVRPYIENNKFKALSVVTDVDSYKTDNSKPAALYLTKTEGYAPIAEVKVAALGEYDTTKPIFAKLSDDKIEFKYDDASYIVNLDGSIDEGLVELTRGKMNILGNTISFNNGSLSVSGELKYTAKLTKNSFEYKGESYTKGINFSEGKITKTFKIESSPIDCSWEIDLNNDFTVKKVVSKAFLSDKTTNYSYSDDFKTITAIDEVQSTPFFAPSQSAPIGGTPISLSTSDKKVIYEYDDNFRLTYHGIIEDLGLGLSFEDYEKRTFDDDGYCTILEAKSDDYYEKTVYSYDTNHYLTKETISSKHNEQDEYEANKTIEYGYDGNHNLIKYALKMAGEDFNRDECEKTFGNNSYTLTKKAFDSNQELNSLNSYKYTVELNEDGSVSRMVAYANDLVTPNVEYIYTYTTENNVSIETVLENYYDTENSNYEPSKKTVIESTDAKIITYESDYNYYKQDYSLNYIEEVTISENCTKTETTYYTTGSNYEDIIDEKEITEKGSDYKIETYLEYSNGEPVYGEKDETRENSLTHYTYDTNKKDFLIETYTEYFEGTEVKKVYRTYSYTTDSSMLNYHEEVFILKANGTDKIIKEESTVEYENDVANKKEVTTYTYDNNYKCTLRVMNVYNSNNELTKCESYTYDENGNTTEKTVTEYENGNKVSEYKTVNEYVENNRVDYLYTTWEDGEFVYKEHIQYLYSNSNELIRTIKNCYENYTDVTYYREVMKYGGEEIVVLEKHTFAGSLLTVYETKFNDDDSIKETITNEYSYNTGKLTKSTTTSYDKDLKDTEIVIEYTDGVATKKEIYRYFGDTKKKTEVYEIESFFTFTNELTLTEEYFYDENGVKQSSITYVYYFSNSYNKIQKTTSYYSNNGLNLASVKDDNYYYNNNGVLTSHEVWDIYDPNAGTGITERYEYHDGEAYLQRKVGYYDIFNKKLDIRGESFDDETKTFSYIFVAKYDDEKNVTSMRLYINDFENNSYHAFKVNDGCESAEGYWSGEYFEAIEGESYEGIATIEKFID